jgi:pilus assembly protein Flp/PilA
MRSLFRRLVVEEEGQGITEYALILGLVVLGVWVAVNNSGIGPEINSLFDRVKSVITGCTSGACGGSS